MAENLGPNDRNRPAERVTPDKRTPAEAAPNPAPPSAPARVGSPNSDYELDENPFTEVPFEESEQPTEEAVEEERNSRWAPEREEALVAMWRNGHTASQIAKTLGGVSRNAVIGKAHRLGLQSRPMPDAADRRGSDNPLAELRGSSLDFRELVRWRSAVGAQLVPGEFALVVEEALTESLQDGDGETILVPARALAASLLRWMARNSDKPMASDLVGRMVSASLKRSSGVQMHGKTNIVLRWDSVELLHAAWDLNAALLPGTSLSIVPILCALVSSVNGQRALLDVGLQPDEFTDLRDDVAEIAAGAAPRRKGGGSMVAFIRDTSLHVPGHRPKPDYSSDRVTAGTDVLGAREDARALAELITLDDVEPPLAIGVFGPWGSGKSTLMAELKMEIERLGRDRADGRRSTAVRRVSNVLQLEFNAWTFADSQNLWASLTSELFDQIAAKKLAGGRSVGAELVSEVAGRVAKEEALLKAAKAEFDVYDDELKAIVEEQAANRVQARTSLFDAAGEAILELLGKEKEEDEKASKAGEAEQALAAQDERPDNRAIELFQKAALAGGMPLETRVRRYADASNGMARICLIVWDYVVLRWKPLAMLAAAFGLAWLAWHTWGQPASHGAWPWLRAAVPWALVGGWLSSAAWILLPALRIVSVLHNKVSEGRRKRAKAAREQAAKHRVATEAKDRAAEVVDRSQKFVGKYASVNDATSAPPALMLEYLLKESGDLAAIRERVGLLATVRRVFHQLDAVVAERREGVGEAVERIVIYIDDLDRCSEKQVVEVLEAVHLLLAFPCFVVVVACDARWLEMALAQTHSQVSSKAVSAADYLEKIFQIPFWVRPLREPRGASVDSPYRRYLRRLLGVAASAAEDTHPDRDEFLIPTDEETGTTLTRIAPYAPEDGDDGRRSQLVLTDKEIDLFCNLGPIASRSPRAVKRMVNLYRLIRVAVPPEALETYLSDDDFGPRAPWFAVQFALANEVGRSAEQMHALADAIRNPSAQWSDWFEPSVNGPSPGYPADAISSALDLDEKRDFKESLGAIAEVIGRPPRKDEIVAALDVIGRYSFRAP